MQKNKSVIAQIISGVLKFLLVAIIVVVIIAVIIPLLLSVFKGKDAAPVNDSGFQLQTINLSKEENAFYDLDKTADLINTKNVPEGKQLVSGYLKSDEWNQQNVKQLLDDNKTALEYFSSAAAKGKFQLPYSDSQSKISAGMPIVSLNNWREISRLSGVKAIWLAKNGQNKEALDEAFKSIIVGNAIENSQSLMITYLVGISIKDNGLDILQKVVSIIPKDSPVLSEYQSKLENYQAAENATPFITEYIVIKQSLDNFGKNGSDELGSISKILVRNKFYFKKNLTLSYYFDFFNKLAIESTKDCAEIKNVQSPVAPLEANNLLKMYFTENVAGKSFVRISESALNSVLEKKCAVENKLKETESMINGQR